MTEQVMTAAPVVVLPGCVSTVTKRKAGALDASGRMLKRSRTAEDLDEGEYSSESEESDDSDAEGDPQRRKFEEGPLAKEARLQRAQRRREKEERARRRRRIRSQRDGGDDGNNANNDDVPLTKEDKERQQKEFLRTLYNNRDYKPVILFFDRNA